MCGLRGVFHERYYEWCIDVCGVTQQGMFDDLKHGQVSVFF